MFVLYQFLVWDKARKSNTCTRIVTGVVLAVGKENVCVIYYKCLLSKDL